MLTVQIIKIPNGQTTHHDKVRPDSSDLTRDGQPIKLPQNGCSLTPVTNVLLGAAFSRKFRMKDVAMLLEILVTLRTCLIVILIKNESVFNRKVWDGKEIFFLIRMRSTFWLRACDEGTLKFNVDGSARRKPRPAGCGGALRNSEGFLVGVFFGPLGVQDSNFAEIMAIKHALHLFSFSPYATTNKLLIEFDSKIALSWILHPSKRPWDKWMLFNDIDSLILQLKEVSFQHTLREGNSFADSLAKYGVDKESMFSAWW
ncbi:Uncharacterized protein TCM_020504 [Theobroma cacao]|uniref:RNase H type-1 domain-containing protein n=1 Tax=Theobroma cacao TaxID=3641 RepID=A0A061EKF2_THECC|nr:Uncharacterized protein TCM_020504 [Theobroma cacao]